MSEKIQPAADEPIADAFNLPLEEFCTRLSKNDRRVEMIGAFYAHEKLAGRLHGSESNFAMQYQAFVNKPV